jgi:RNA polymerase sigma-54 factor
MVYFLLRMMNLRTIQVQKQIFAPTLQHSIEVLMLPILELHASIDQELQANPLLEVDETKSDDDPNIITDELRDYFIKKSAQSEDSFSIPNADDDPEDRSTPLKKEETLEDDLLRQLRMDISDLEEIAIGEFIIGNINEDGYLTITCEEIGSRLSVKDLGKIEKVLNLIQSYEPTGIASRNLQECLLAQVNGSSNGHEEIIRNIIQNCLTELSQKKYLAIARKLHIPVAKVKESALLISHLDPKPARNYRPLKANIYITPDVYVMMDENGNYQIHLNKQDIPRIRINPLYKQLLKENNLRPEEKQFIREKMKNALLFIKSVEQRGQTVMAITKFILEKQKDFFKNGHMSLSPMTLRDVAQAVKRNESTVSRAINNKYIETPKGLFPLKFFFSQAVNGHGQPDANNVTSRSIKEEMRDLIENEEESAPLSDQQIQEYFAQRGITIARRTINKYRKSLQILPSHLRKK